MTSADNQQERPDEGLCQYIAGFVDGEGSFSTLQFSEVGLRAWDSRLFRSSMCRKILIELKC